MMKDKSAELIDAIKAECAASATLSQEAVKRFFKTDAGSYGAHDAFLGITVPTLRKISKNHQDLPLDILELLIQSKYNEERLLALLILVNQYQKGDAAHQEKSHDFYLNNLKYVNNWNLVDSSAHHILGHYLSNRDRAPLKELAQSEILWYRRISIVATWYFIRVSDTSTTFEIAELLLKDKHDLIHKAVGWMLREAGKKDEPKLLSFLDKYNSQMPKTMLRYAIERLDSIGLNKQK